MDNKKKLLKAKETLEAKLESIGSRFSPDGRYELARIANMPYDAELPVPEVIEKVCKVARVEKGEDYEYFSISPETKTVYTISNGSITQANVTPDTENELTFNSYNGPAENVYLEKLMEAKYEPLKVKQKAIMEALNRKETKDVLDILIASAEGQSKTYSLDSGETYLKFDKIEEMIRGIEKYGKNFVLITGTDVAGDVRLLNYNEDKNQPLSLKQLGIVDWIVVSNFQYTHSTTQTVLASDKAILVALNDSEDERPVHFVRRKIKDVFNDGQTKERVIVSSGPRLTVGSNAKWAYEIAVMEQYGVVQPNPYAVAVFKRASSYA
ncbi:MAG: hypothetical protein ACTSWG_10495 [Candidatus Helarchaeota archaeon]